MRHLVLSVVLVAPLTWPLVTQGPPSLLERSCAAAPAPEPLHGGPDLLAPLADEMQGRAMSETPGGTVEAKGKGKPVVLKDGELVTFETDDGEMGTSGPATATLLVRKRRVKVPNGRVIIENRLKRSPDRKWAVFTAISACGDYLYASGWLLGPGLRLELSKEDFGPDVAVAWRSDGKEVAVGSRSLFLISLPDAKVTDLSGYVSPAYGPDDRLYVRGNDKSDAVYEWVPGGKPRKILAMGGSPPEQEAEFDPGDPDPVTFSADGKLLATFQRGGATRIRSLALGGARPSGDNGSGDGAAAAKPAAIEATLSQITDPATEPGAAAKAAKTAGDANPSFARELAVAANTRGYRLLQEGKVDDAIPLFDTATALDKRYGMPRYNLARAHALKGNAKESVVHLRALKTMGKAQQARLENAPKDDAFQKIADSEEFRALFTH